MKFSCSEIAVPLTLVIGGSIFFDGANEGTLTLHADSCGDYSKGCFSYIQPRNAKLSHPNGTVMVKGAIIEAGYCPYPDYIPSEGNDGVDQCYNCYSYFQEALKDHPSAALSYLYVNYTSTNPRAPHVEGDNAGVALSCVLDYNETIDKGMAEEIYLSLVNGTFEGYTILGTVKGQVRSKLCKSRP